MIYLHKVLPLFFSPLCIMLLVVLFGLIFNSRKTIFFAIIIFIPFSMPIISNKLIMYLEHDFPFVEKANIGKADAVVVLSGMVRAVQNGDRVIYEWTESSDRIFSGIELTKIKKAPFLVLTRGKLPWDRGRPEGEYLAEVAQTLGVSKDKILITEVVENTEQEAISVKKLLGNNKKTIILVTSAFHMPRAIKVFEAQGFITIPFPVDYLSTVTDIAPMSFIPSSSGLNDSSLFLREMIGRLYYNLKY